MEQFLATKLYVPSIRPEFVSRPHLIQTLNKGLYRKLTLISAPAGFGKTTLVSEWLDNLGLNSPKKNQDEYRIAWLSLDEGDNDLIRFLTYFLAALNQADGNDSVMGENALTMLRAHQPLPAETILISLINDIAAFPEKFVFVLDDYHLIETQKIHKALGFLLENLPLQLHLVIATREDPFLPLSRMRARDQVTELRAADLRFTTSEAGEFLNRVMALELSTGDIDALEKRTEGWIAGLQLAAISLQGKENTSQHIKSFSGSYRLVLDYLVEEVLEGQTEGVQKFLLQTSILNQLTGSLCDALTGQNNGQQVLESLEHANLFIVQLDEKRHWYRYHHLFADLLRQRLHQKYPGKISKLHQCASEWYEREELWSDAIHHALAFDDVERAADLIELAWHPMNMSYQSVLWLSWAKTLPEELVRSRPALSTACGWASLDTGDLEAAERCFQNAERWLTSSASGNKKKEKEKDEASAGKKIILDGEELRVLSISIANGRAYLAQALGDVSGTIKYAQQAADRLHENEHFERGLSNILAGFAYWTNGELQAAHDATANAIEKMQTADKIPFIISFASYLADILVAQGQLHEAVRTYLQVLESVAEQGESEVRETAVLHLGLSEIYFEQGDMAAALRHLERSDALGKHPAFPPWYRHWIWARTRARRSLGDLDGTLELLNDAEQLYYRHPIPDVRPLKALLARAWIATGHLTEVQDWSREQGLSVYDDLTYLREFEHITLARAFIAQYKGIQEDIYIQDAKRLLERLLAAAEEGGRTGSVIEILILQALACEAQRDTHAALRALERALTLAEPEGYFRIFVDEGPPMARLLYEALSRESSPEYVQSLLAVFPTIEPKSELFSRTESPGTELIEHLSDRELEILGLLAKGLTNQEIGSKLYLSLNTVKAHTRNIYGKLGVNSRTQASARARSLGLISVE